MISIDCLTIFHLFKVGGSTKNEKASDRYQNSDYRIRGNYVGI